VAGTQIVQDFDGVALGAFPNPNPSAPSPNIGTYTRTGTTPADVAAASLYGGAGGTGRFMETFNQAGGNYIDLDLTTAGAPGAADGGVGYFGFWWSAGDGNNELVVTMKDGSTQTFVTQSIIDSPSLQGTKGTLNSPVNGHWGNPNCAGAPLTSPCNGFTNAFEAYAFVNIYANNDASRIASIRFRELPGNTQGFETDNHTVIVGLIDPDNQTGGNVPVPVPATALLLGAGIGLIGWTRRRRRAAE
jgi:hypothetical protein